MNPAASILYLKFKEDGKRIVSQSKVLSIFLETGRPDYEYLDELSSKVRLLVDISAAFDAGLIHTLAGDMARLIGLIKCSNGIRRSETVLILKESLDLMAVLFDRIDEYSVREANAARRLSARIATYLEKNMRRKTGSRENRLVGYHPMEESKFLSAYRSFMPAWN